MGAAVGALSEDPSLGFVYGDVELIDEKSRVTGADIQGPFDLAMYFGRLMYVPQPGTFFSRKALEAVGGWRAAFSYTADADFWFRIALHFPVYKLESNHGALPKSTPANAISNVLPFVVTGRKMVVIS